jgi:hypothetical protein
MSINPRPCAYDYNIERTYQKLQRLVGNIVLFRSYIGPEEYTCGKLTGVKVRELRGLKGTGKFGIDIEFSGLTIDFRYKPTVPEIKEYFERVEKMSPEERIDWLDSQYGHEYLAFASQSLKIGEEIEAKLSKTPRWRFLERRKIKQNAQKKLKEALIETVGPDIMKPLVVGEKHYPMVEFHYGSRIQRIFSKDEIKSMQKIKI